MNLHRLFSKLFTRPASTASRRAQPAVEQLESRLVPYSASGSVWSAHPELITISFMPDGTSVNGYSSNLFSTFNAKFGAAATWQNQILKAAQFWAQQTNINFAVVADNGAAAGSGSSMQGDPNFGDIRIGGYNFGNSSLAQAYLPPTANNYSVAGDIQFNTGQTFNVGSTYDLFSVAMHEIGHALGLYHSTTAGTVMNATYGGVKTALATDDINGIRNLYSANAARAKDSYDAASDNGTTAKATVITALINATTKTAVVNNMDLSTTSELDIYKFVIPAGSSTTLKAKVQSQGLSLLSPKVELLNSSGSVVATTTAAATAYGTTITASYTGVAAGQTYFVRVSSTNATAAFKTGRYALMLNLGTGADATPTMPATQTANGSPLASGGGQAYFYTPADTPANATTALAQQTNTSGQQNVALDAFGNSIVTWASQDQDGSGWGVYARRFDSKGAPLGNEFLVNTTTAGDQLNPTVAMDDVGNFMIVWQSQNKDTLDWDVCGRVFNALGLGTSEFRVNATTAGDQTHPSVALDLLGKMVVTWTSAGQDGSGLGVYAQRYQTVLATFGVAVGPEFRVNTTTTGDQTEATVGIDWAGNFVIAWTSADGGGKGVYAQRFNAGGAAQGGEFRVNTVTTNDQVSPDVGMDRDGNFAIVWASYSQDANNSWGIYAQAYLANGTAAGAAVRVNTTTAGDQTGPSGATDSGGNLIVTWTSSGQDGSGKGVYAQLLDVSTGALVHEEFRVNIDTLGDQYASSVAINRLGYGVAAWTGVDAGGTGVYTRLFHVRLDAYEGSSQVSATVSNGSLTVTGDAFANQLQIVQLAAGRYRIDAFPGTLVNGSASATVSNITADVTINLGNGDDSLQMMLVAPRHLTIDMGAGNDTLSLGGFFELPPGAEPLPFGVEVKGNLVIKTSVQDSTLSSGYEALSSGDGFRPQADSISVFDSLVWGSALLTTGPQDDFVTLFNTQFKGALAVDTGAGRDWLEVNRVTVEGVASFQAGSGADTVVLLDSVFAGDFTADGGAGTDTLTDSGNLFKKRKTLKGF